MFPAVVYARLLLLIPVILSGCQTVPTFSKEQQEARRSMEAEISREPLGDYFIGRRYYKSDYKMWGYLRRPREPWSDSRLVMFNEDRTIAPDRSGNAIGSDNGYEYKLWGRFSGESVYEPAANQFYPEFILRRAELRNNAPGPIFTDPKGLNPEERYYPNPY
jgi:hypothetical protein